MKHRSEILFMLKAIEACIWITVIVGALGFAALSIPSGRWLAWLIIAVFAFRSLFDVLDEW